MSEKLERHEPRSGHGAMHVVKSRFLAFRSFYQATIARASSSTVLTDILNVSFAMRRILAGVVVLAFTLLSLGIVAYFARGRISQLYQKKPSFPAGPNLSASSDNSSVADGIILNAAQISIYVDAILVPESTGIENFECPALNGTRYESLKTTGPAGAKFEYFFPLNLRQNLDLLPTLLGSIVEAMRFLGPELCVLSIVEGNSPDGTSEVLEALRPRLEGMGITYFFQSSSMDPSEDDRIEKLAKLRNAALRPLYENPHLMSETSTVVFLNDVVACVDDVLELTYQLRTLDADMACAMDWNPGNPPWFYDSWIARGIDGDTFFEFPEPMGFDNAHKLFWHLPQSARRLEGNRPFQVFACWNGGVTVRAKPLLDGLQFRAPDLDAGECVQGEPQVFCKDLWYRGYGKIAVISSVNFGYTISSGPEIKEKKGFASDLVGNQDPEDDKIGWKGPPANVKCIEPWSKQYWQPWDATLGQSFNGTEAHGSE